MHRLYRVAPNFQLPVDLAELDVSVQHERLCSATARIPASRHHDAPSVAACPGRTVGKRLARVTMRLEGRGGGRWHSSRTGQGLDAGKCVPHKAALLQGGGGNEGCEKWRQVGAKCRGGRVMRGSPPLASLGVSQRKRPPLL